MDNRNQYIRDIRNVSCKILFSALWPIYWWEAFSHSVPGQKKSSQAPGREKKRNEPNSFSVDVVISKIGICFFYWLPGQ